ncbi:ATPase family associated with various cellular activities (AAA) [Rubritalea squalenifaciens DSM 18772]|uniref:ATPase family associated with various cellular activities (AAA) n=1 Tax=Rubritalea squalenifaciens DSM 18772 TaxID=1123071 RepID=A0A1M6DK81_9BACT|nr:ATP-binding protein [Rubritalea squalenifaciens]SHI73541.1 ATPase family associated with various cellular activities (AAA) [Rubritalea squalenifaciens DSM 18772]
MNNLPAWADEVIASYESGAAGCFVLHGNVNDRLIVPRPDGSLRLGNLSEFLMRALLPRFDVVLSYDLGFGMRVERGGEVFSEWPSLGDTPELPHLPLPAIRTLTHYMQYCRNLKIMGQKAPKVAVIVRQSHLVCPAIPNLLNYELSSMASLLRGWAADGRLCEFGQAAFLISENMNGLHPLVADCPNMDPVEIPLPAAKQISATLELLKPDCPQALGDFVDQLDLVASRLTGATVSSVEALLKRREHDKKPLDDDSLADLKKDLVERDCDGLIDFVEPDRTLDDVVGLDGVKQWLRQDIELWKQGELEALPMGYLFCGPVGTGKTYLAECLAGEAGVPVVTMRNFRDKWVGSTEANLEKIFALLHALGRCIVFVDEADQALGKRQGGSGDSGVSSRVYSMMAKEMSNTRNRGKIMWVLASSRPDLIEVDLKRPGRVDVKIPLFPTLNKQEGFSLIRALCKRRDLSIKEEDFPVVEALVPDLLTPGAAETISVQTFRLSKTSEHGDLDALLTCLRDYRPPIAHETLKFQMRLAMDEATDASLIPSDVNI